MANHRTYTVWDGTTMDVDVVTRPDHRTVRPEPRLVKGYFPPQKREMLHDAKRVVLGKGLVFAAPSQDLNVLIEEYGCFVSPSFMREVEGKDPRWCFNLHEQGTYERKRSTKSETLRQTPA